MPPFLKITTSVTLCWALLVAPCSAQRAMFFGANTLQPWSMGYCGYDCPPAANLDFHGITHLIMAWAHPNAAPGCTLDMTTEDMNSISSALITAAHANGVQVLISLYGATNLADCTDAGNLATFVSEIGSVVSSYGFDGVDLDWEPFSSATNGTKMTNLISSLRTALPRPKVLTAAAIVDEHAWWGTVSSIKTNLDALNVMTYDLWTGEAYSYHNSARIGPVGDGSWSVELAIRRYLAGGWPAARLGIGLPFYGYQWLGGTSPNVNGPNITWTVGTPTRDQIHFKDIRPLITDPGNYNYDTDADVPYLSANSGAASVLFYDNERSIAAKVAYAKQRGLGGVIIWNLAMDYFSAETPKNVLLNAVKKAR